LGGGVELSGGGPFVGPELPQPMLRKARSKPELMVRKRERIFSPI